MEHQFARKTKPAPGTNPGWRTTPVKTHRLGFLQRKCACGTCAACGAQQTLQRDVAGDSGPATAPKSVRDVLRSSGEPLDAATRAFMEPRFGHNFSKVQAHARPQGELPVTRPGDTSEREADRAAAAAIEMRGPWAGPGHDFSHVRIHTDADAAKSAHAVNALAYTVGRHVVFGAGQFAPSMDSGRRLIAHELAHVVQQQAMPSFNLQKKPDEAVNADAAKKDPEKSANSAVKAEPLADSDDPWTDLELPTDATEQLIVGAIFAEASAKAGDDERKCIGLCIINMAYYGGLTEFAGKKCYNSSFGDGTVLSATKKGILAYGGNQWNLVMDGNALKSKEALTKKLAPGNLARLKAALDSANDVAALTAPAADPTSKKVPIQFNQAKDQPPSKARQEKIDRYGPHTFYGFKAGRECQ